MQILSISICKIVTDLVITLINRIIGVTVRSAEIVALHSYIISNDHFVLRNDDIPGYTKAQGLVTHSVEI